MADDKPFHNPFGVLRSLKVRPGDENGDGPSPVPAPTPNAPSSTPALSTSKVPRAVVRMERAGRGGKEVTIVEQLGLAEAELASWLKALKGQLGCGGVLEGSALVLQGDHRKRLPAILTARGVKRVTIG